MGTNFYFMIDGKEYRHIGKRSAAGPFCWDCGLSLSSGGHDCIHQSRTRFLKECAVCGRTPIEESVGASASGRELGFNQSIPKPKSGVASCSSFRWAISPGAFFDIKKSKNVIIEDEYGEKYSQKEFSDVLSECPVKFFDSIGDEFS